MSAAALSRNLFPAVRSIVAAEPDFPWHRDRSGALTASSPHSSQALAVDFFGTVRGLSSRDAVVGAWLQELGVDRGMRGPWSLSLEALVEPKLLGEPRPTQVDALARGTGGVILFECKFTERDGGSCSQTRPLTSGVNAGRSQCNGNYELQVNPVNGVRASCALAGKGVRYWQHVPSVLRISHDARYRPCPFAGGWYQWMRNLVVAAAFAGSYRCPAAVLVVYAEGPFPMAAKIHSEEWKRLQACVAGGMVPFRAVSYQRLMELALIAAQVRERDLLGRLRDWIERKISRAAALPPGSA